MSGPVVTLTMPAKADYLILARLALAGISRAVAIDPETLADLKLAVTEACANAVRHAYGAEGGQVTVSYRVDGGLLAVQVEDEGTGFDVERVDEWVPEELDEAGMGLSIIRSVVDGLEVERGTDGRGTRLRLEKRLAAAG
jgi:serine/threonine-protein kinase RsbW